MRRLGVSVALLVATGCGDKGGDGITIGAILSQTGSLAAIGAEQAQAAQLAIDEINRAGGVRGASLRLVVKDDATDPAKGAAAAAELITAKVPAVLGAIGSQSTLDVAAVLAPAKIVQISGSSTSPAITDFQDGGYLFRTCASDALQGKLLARRAKDRGLTQVAVVHLPGAYGVGLADEFSAAFSAGGGTVTKRVQYAEGQQSYQTMLTDVFATNPEAVLLIAYPDDGGQIIRDYNQSFSSRGTFWYFTDALQDSAFIDAVGGSNFTFQHEGTGAGTPGGARYAAYTATFKTRYGVDSNPGSFGVNVYDAVYLIALAIEAGGKSDALTIRDHLAAVSSGGTAYGAAEFAAAAMAARAGQDVDYEGASGNVDLDASGDTVAPYGVWKVMSGTLTTIEPSVLP